MAAIFAFKCTCCGQIHEGSPSIAFKAPDHYARLTDEQKSSMGRLSDDFCVIKHNEGTDYFIRAVLEVPILAVEEPFLWGIWVSLSEKSFRRYWDTYEDPCEGDGFFGWVCNEISVYSYPSTRPADVVVQRGKQRPTVILHRRNSGDDPLVIDQVNGISIERAQRLAEQVHHGS
jgi:hypothetical protein